MKPTKRTDVAALDRAAQRALQRVDERPKTQLAMLDALEDLRAGCTAIGKTSVLAREVNRLLDERRRALRAFHLSRVARAVDNNALAGAGSRDDTERAIEEALVVIGRFDGDDSGDLRTLRARLDDVRRGRPGRPRPFFARYLEHQRR